MASEEKKSLVPVTKGGDLIQVSTTKLPYTTTTADCGKYLQRKLDGVSKIKQNHGEDGLGNITVKLSTIRVSDIFYPFVITLPLSATQSVAKQSKGSSIFDTNENQKMVELKPEIFNILKKYMYDKNTLSSTNFMKDVKISRQQADNLKNIRTPRIKKFGNEKCVIVLLDPMRLFLEMLTDPSQPATFNVNILKTDRIQDTNYRYSIERALAKKNKGNNKSFEKMLAGVVVGNH